MQPISTPQTATQPAAELPEAVAAAPIAEAPAREPVKPPEYAATTEPSIMPQDPVVKLPTPPTSEGLHTPSPLIILPDHILRAEKNLAAHLGKYIDPSLTQGLELTLLSTPINAPTDVTLCLAGPTVLQKSEEIAKEALAALKDVPQIAPLFDGAHPPHFQKPKEIGKENMVHIHIPHLTTTQYANLIHALADGIVPVQKPLADAPTAAIPTSIIATPATNEATLQPEKQLANGAVR